jgi:uncharacterized protein (TIGR03435 family)
MLRRYSLNRRDSRLRLVLLAAVALAALPAAAQEAEPTSVPSFDVASVKQNKADGPQHSNVPLDTGNVYAAISPSDSRSAAGGYFVATNQPLWKYIVFAYQLSGTQELALRFSYFDGLKSKTPGWVTGGFDSSADRYTIEARAPENTTLDQMRRMMRSLLAERFQLAVHYETREAPAFALVLVRPGTTGPNLRPHPASDACDAAAPEWQTRVARELPPVCGVIAHVPSATDPHSAFGGRGVGLGLLASSLPTMTGMAVVPKPVVDRTGLDGLYDFTLEWSLPPDAQTIDTAAAFRGALKSQLGLELKPVQAPIDILVIDRIERPSEN